MPKRQNTRRINSEAVQGEDSFLVLRSPTVREARAAQSPGGGLEDTGRAFLRTVIVEWNWVDDDGNPLPQAKDDPNVVDLLTAGELEFINQNLTGTPKN